MASEKPKTKGWLSFIIAGVMYVIGYRVFTGELPGAQGAVKWWSFLILLFLWGTVDYLMSGKFGSQKGQSRDVP